MRGWRVGREDCSVSSARFPSGKKLWLSEESLNSAERLDMKMKMDEEYLYPSDLATRIPRV